MEKKMKVSKFLTKKTMKMIFLKQKSNHCKTKEKNRMKVLNFPMILIRKTSNLENLSLKKKSKILLKMR